MLNLEQTHFLRVLSWLRMNAGGVLNPSEDLNNNYPSDLHVLSTPPAFILSQDQTL